MVISQPLRSPSSTGTLYAQRRAPHVLTSNQKLLSHVDGYHHWLCESYDLRGWVPEVFRHAGIFTTVQGRAGNSPVDRLIDHNGGNRTPIFLRGRSWRSLDTIKKMSENHWLDRQGLAVLAGYSRMPAFQTWRKPTRVQGYPRFESCIYSFSQIYLFLNLIHLQQNGRFELSSGPPAQRHERCFQRVHRFLS